jgi:ribosomal protein S18 acetylase RimI-like enzyme
MAEPHDRVGVIRAAVVADAAAVIALWRKCDITRPWNDPSADFTRAVDGLTSTILIVQAADGAMLGSVMVGHDGHRGWIYYLAVDPMWQRRGLGRELMAAAENWLHLAGAPKLQLMVREGNDAALAFYEALGLERQPVVTLGRFIR